MRIHLQALALMAAVSLPTTASMPGTNRRSAPEDKPGPIGKYDMRAVLAAEKERRRQKHAEKMARRAARRS